MVHPPKVSAYLAGENSNTVCLDRNYSEQIRIVRLPRPGDSHFT